METVVAKKASDANEIAIEVKEWTAAVDEIMANDEEIEFSAGNHVIDDDDFAALPRALEAVIPDLNPLNVFMWFMLSFLTPPLKT